MSKRDEVREQIAELEHIQWQHWARVRNPDHPLIDVPYSELTEEQKEQDRVWARKILSISGLEVVEEAELPKCPYKVMSYIGAYKHSQQDMWDAGIKYKVVEE